MFALAEDLKVHFWSARILNGTGQDTDPLVKSVNQLHSARI